MINIATLRMLLLVAVVSPTLVASLFHNDATGGNAMNPPFNMSMEADACKVGDADCAQHTHLIQVHSNLETKVRTRSAESNDAYDKLYKDARTYFSYESPLGEKQATRHELAWFRHAPMAFDFQEPKQLKLWQGFIDAGFVKEQDRDILNDRNGMYPELDRTFLFCFLQRIQPARMLEIGSGESTEVARKALLEVTRNGGRVCHHSCIEPYRANEVPQGVSVIQKEMQEIDVQVFDELEAGDVLFIDSSHVIKPYGDTLTELVNILPRLNTGVYVHIHDIFLPDDYPQKWGLPDGIKNKVYTEQWAVKLLLDGSETEWEVIWSSHLMASKYPKDVMRMPHYPLAGTAFFAPYGTGGPGRLNAALWLLKKGKPVRPIPVG